MILCVVGVWTFVGEWSWHPWRTSSWSRQRIQTWPLSCRSACFLSNNVHILVETGACFMALHRNVSCSTTCLLLSVPIAQCSADTRCFALWILCFHVCLVFSSHLHLQRLQTSIHFNICWHMWCQHWTSLPVMASLRCFVCSLVKWTRTLTSWITIQQRSLPFKLLLSVWAHLTPSCCSDQSVGYSRLPHSIPVTKAITTSWKCWVETFEPSYTFPEVALSAPQCPLD